MYIVAYQALKKKMILSVSGGSDLDLILSHVGASAHAHYVHRNKGCVCKVNGCYSIAGFTALF